jgi:ABC-type branched-subunit amino acid transport system substrate-binding protein
MALALLGTGLLAQAAEPIVLAQSLPLTGAGFTTSSRIVAGSNAAVDAFNRAGGAGGRFVKLVTVDDGNDPARHAANLRHLVEASHPVAFLNCVGDLACIAAAGVARATQVSLIGPMSGAAPLRSIADAPVFCIRPDVSLEAAALAGQLKSLGVGKVAILTDSRGSGRTSEILMEALRRKGLASFIVHADTSRMAAALEQANRASALLIDLGLEGAEALGEQAPAALEGEAKVVASLATPGLATVMRLFPGRVIGFTAVVPQPELPNSALVRSLLRDSEALGPEAMTYEGLEAYVDTLVALEAIRRAGPQATARSVGAEMARLGHVELGGFAMTFGRPGRSASEWVDIGLRARNGVLLR